MATGLSQRGYKELFEDWTGADNIGTTVADGLLWLNSSDTGNTAFAIVADAQGPIAQAATDNTDNDMCEIAYHLLSWSVQNGELYMETRVKVVADVDSVAFNVGFNDDVLEDSNTLPVELSGTTWTTNASTWVGIAYDIDADNDNVHAMWVDDDADAVEAIADLRFNDITPVNDEWFGVGIRLSDRGAGRGVRAEFTVVEESTGKIAQKAFNTGVDRDVLLTPHIGFENRAGAIHTFEIDYIYVKQSRSTT